MLVQHLPFCLLLSLPVYFAFTPHPLTTPWTDEVDLENPWPEYPRPQFVRESWQSLNGPWDYSITDPEGNLVEEGVVIVPYCLESMLSNVSHGLEKGQVLTYRKVVRVPEAWIGKVIVLNFEAVDYETEVFIDGEPGLAVPPHKGGFDSFSAYFRATDAEALVEVSSWQKLNPHTIHIPHTIYHIPSKVRVKDPTTGEAIPVGKQVCPKLQFVEIEHQLHSDQI